MTSTNTRFLKRVTRTRLRQSVSTPRSGTHTLS
nr:MAG TPA: hypothetical protein [Caudoviricetes sp.]